MQRATRGEDETTSRSYRNGGWISLSALLLLAGWRAFSRGGRGRRRGLGILQVPAATERLVELHVGKEPIEPDLRLRVLGWEEPLQGLEDFEVAGEAIEIAIVGNLHGLLERLHAASLLDFRPGQLLEGRQAGGHFLEGLNHGLLVPPLRFLGEGLAGLEVLVDLAALEDGTRDRAAGLPHRGGASRQRR